MLEDWMVKPCPLWTMRFLVQLVIRIDKKKKLKIETNDDTLLIPSSSSTVEISEKILIISLIS